MAGARIRFFGHISALNRSLQKTSMHLKLLALLALGAPLFIAPNKFAEMIAMNILKNR